MEVKTSAASISVSTPTSHTVSGSQTSSSTRPNVRVTALEPPSWSGKKADFYTWQKKFIHIMDEAKISDELTQLCYLQNQNRLPLEYQTLITDCSSMSQVWSRLEERVPKETIKFEIISQFRCLKPLHPKKTPTDLRNFANEISLFCRRMEDIGLTKDNYSCIVLQDVYERLDFDTSSRYRSKMELRQEILAAAHSSTALSDFECDLDSLCKFIRSEATTLELSKGSTQPEKPNSSNVIPPKPPPLPAKTLYAVQVNRCVLGCPDSHRLIDCSIYMGYPITERIDFVKNSKRCYVCLVTYHTSLNCPKKKSGNKCRFCSDVLHHWTLCQQPQPPLPQNSKPSLKQQLQQLQPHLQQLQQPSNILHPHSSGSSSGFQATATPFVPDTSKPQGPQLSFHQTVDQSPNSRTSIFAPLVIAEVRTGEGLWVRANFFLDNGSNASLVKTKFAELLKLRPCGAANVKFDVAGGGTHHERGKTFRMEVRALNGERSYMVEVTGIKKPCARVRPISSDIFDKHAHLNLHKEVLHTEGGEVDVLIGSDYGLLITAQSNISAPIDPDSSPSIACTRLGSYIYGGLNHPPHSALNNVISVNFIDLTAASETAQLKDFFYSDVIGVKPTSICSCSDNEIAEAVFIKHVKKTTRINDEGRVEVSAPWRPGFPECLPNNFAMAKDQMLRRLSQCERDGTLELYNGLITDLIDRGVVRILGPEETKKCKDEPAWYLSHHIVERVDKETTKHRLVFNSALPYSGVCLNDAFEKGPDYTNSLFSVFLQWRASEIAVSGDMEKMFNQIATCERDRRYHRFLWRFGDVSSPIVVFEWGRVLFGDKPSPDLAGFALRFLADRSKRNLPAGAAVLENNTYIDDVGYSTDTDHEANGIKNEVNTILGQGKFSIKSWNSNSTLVDENPDAVKVDFLGHIWDKRDDTVNLKARELFDPENFEFTKKVLMGVVARIWDPSGSRLPVTIRYRIHLQQLWQEGFGWEEQVGPDLVAMWEKNLIEMEKLRDFPIRRCLKPSNVTSEAPQLHGFSDGGDKAFGTCIFVRWQTTTGIEIRFVAAKAFVAPLKHKTTPRLELMGAVAMGRLMKEVESALPYDFGMRTLWIDSEVVIHWVNSVSNRHKPFVSCRIQELQDTYPNLTDKDMFPVQKILLILSPSRSQ